MAGVQVPRLNRIQPQGTPSEGRSGLQVPDIASANRPLQAAVSNVAEGQVEYFQKQEDYAIDTAAKAAQNEYHIYLNQQLAMARQSQGDPSKVYSDFDEARSKKYDEILNKNPDMSDRAKSAIRSALSGVSNEYQARRDTAFASQYYDYDRGVTDSAVKIAGQDMSVAASYIQPGNEKSFEAMDSLIRRIDGLYKTHGEKFGAVTRDEFGNQIATDGIKVQTGKAVSESLVSAINNLNASGHPELADAVFSKYYKYIDAYKVDDVKKRIVDETRTVKALTIAETLIGKSVETINTTLKREFPNDPIGRDKALQAIDTITRRNDNIKDRISSDSAMQAYRIVSAKMNSADPYANVMAMEEDPNLKDLLPKITSPSAYKGLRQMVQQPKDSNPVSRNKAFVSFYNDEFKGMVPEKFNELLIGLNKEDRNKFEKLYQKYNSPLTTQEEIKQMNALGKDLIPQLQLAGYVSKKTDFNAYSNTEQKKIIAAQNEFLDEMNNLPINMTYQMRLDYLKKFASKKMLQKETEEANTGIFSFGRSSPSQPATTVQTPSGTAQSPFSNTILLDDQQRRKNAVNMWMVDPENPNRDRPTGPTTKEIDDYIKAKGL